jgi:hypothetical protein
MGLKTVWQNHHQPISFRGAILISLLPRRQFFSFFTVNCTVGIGCIYWATVQINRSESIINFLHINQSQHFMFFYIHHGIRAGLVICSNSKSHNLSEDNKEIQRKSNWVTRIKNQESKHQKFNKSNKVNIAQHWSRLYWKKYKELLPVIKSTTNKATSHNRKPTRAQHWSQPYWQEYQELLAVIKSTTNKATQQNSHIRKRKKGRLC